MARVENLNIDVLRRTTEGLDRSKVSKFPKLQEWLSGSAFPTVKQLMAFAKTVNLPFGYFFLDSIPDRPYPIPHYRTMGNGTFEPSSELFDTISIVKEKQIWARDLLIDLGAGPLPFAGQTKIDESVEEVSGKISSLLKLDGYWASHLKSWSESLRLLVERTEEAGIFVILNGVVDSNTKRKLDINEFRGFVLYDEIAPFVFVNNSDFVAGKIFTIVHEIVHVLVGSSASFDLRELKPSENEIEQFCDQVTAEFLVPSDQLRDLILTNEIDFQFLARYFKVSEIVIARRLFDLKLISNEEYFDFYYSYLDNLKKIEKNSSGGNYYNTAPYRISRKFFGLVNNAAKQNKILYRDAFRLIGLKPKTYDEYLIRSKQ